MVTALSNNYKKLKLKSKNGKNGKNNFYGSIKERNAIINLFSSFILLSQLPLFSPSFLEDSNNAIFMKNKNELKDENYENEKQK